MTKEQKKNIKRLARLRRTSGDKLMMYDDELNRAFEEIGVDFTSYEFGLNSIFLITEPKYCEKGVLKILSEIEKEGEINV